MDPITRRNFLAGAGALSAWYAAPEGVSPAEASESQWPGGNLENAAFRLALAPQAGLRNAQAVHVPSGLTVADSGYAYSFGRPQFKDVYLDKSGDGALVLSLRGAVPGTPLEVLQQFHLPHAQPWFEEQITLTNRSSQPVDLRDGRCGFLLSLPLAHGQLSGRWSEFKVTAIPYRRDPGGHRTQYSDYTLEQVLTEPWSFEPVGGETIVDPVYAAEGWAWTDGKRGFLVTKYSQQGMELSLLDRANLEGDRIALRWGGCGIWRGEPAHGAWLEPGESHPFGVTRLTAYAGGIAEGYYTFREEMAARGHGCPTGFDPPVHWNELYDNKLWWLPGRAARRRRDAQEVLHPRRHENRSGQGPSHWLRSSLPGSRLGHPVRLEDLGRSAAGPLPGVYRDATARLRPEVVLAHALVRLVRREFLPGGSVPRGPLRPAAHLGQGLRVSAPRRFAVLPASTSRRRPGASKPWPTTARPSSCSTGISTTASAGIGTMDTSCRRAARSM